MSRFEDYEKVTDPLILPIRGKEYRIPEVGANDGNAYIVYAEKVAEAVEARKTDSDAPFPEPMATDEEYKRMFLGSAYDEMMADNVPDAAIKRAFVTAIADFQRDRATAEIIWKTGADPKALEKYLNPPPNRAARRASQRSTGTASARKTPSRASTSSTKTSPTSE
jgi:hypothetical protein